MTLLESSKRNSYNPLYRKFIFNLVICCIGIFNLFFLFPPRTPPSRLTSESCICVMEGDIILRLVFINEADRNLTIFD